MHRQGRQCDQPGRSCGARHHTEQEACDRDADRPPSTPPQRDASEHARRDVDRYLGPGQRCGGVVQLRAEEQGTEPHRQHERERVHGSFLSGVPPGHIRCGQVLKHRSRTRQRGPRLPQPGHLTHRRPALRCSASTKVVAGHAESRSLTDPRVAHRRAGQVTRRMWAGYREARVDHRYFTPSRTQLTLERTASMNILKQRPQAPSVQPTPHHGATPSPPTLPVWRLNLMRVGYLVMGAGLAVVQVARTHLSRPVGAQARHRRHDAGGHVGARPARVALPPADAAHPDVRGRLEAAVARHRRAAAVAGRRPHRGDPRAGRYGPVGKSSSSPSSRGATCSASSSSHAASGGADMSKIITTHLTINAARRRRLGDPHRPGRVPRAGTRSSPPRPARSASENV